MMTDFAIDSVLHLANHIHHIKPAIIQALSIDAASKPRRENIIAALQSLASSFMEILDQAAGDAKNANVDADGHQPSKRVRANIESSSNDNKEKEHANAIISSIPAPECTIKPSKMVLNDPDLLTHVFAYLVMGDRASTVVMTRLACISKMWKDFSRQDRFWAPITAALVPVAAKNDGAIVKQRRRGDGYFAYLRDYGKSVIDHFVCFDRSVEEDLILGFEVWDERDGFCIYSGAGKLEGDYDSDNMYLDFSDDSSSGIAPSFSAASRNALSIEHYFRHTIRVCIRTTLTCKRTQRMIVLTETKKESHYLDALDEAEHTHLPRGCYQIRPPGYGCQRCTAQMVGMWALAVSRSFHSSPCHL